MASTQSNFNDRPLPTDVLQDVFSVLVSEICYNSEDHANSDFDIKRLRALLFCLSGVSRHWRHAATSKGTLWTDAVNPLDCRPEAFDYILSQTALSPLKLLGRSERKEFAGMSAPQWAKLLPHMDRVTHIDLGFPLAPRALEDLASCWGSLRPPRSNLESLVLSCMSRTGLTYKGQGFQVGQELENLRTLKLYRVGISPQPVVYNNLTRLHIEMGDRQEETFVSRWWQPCFWGQLKSLEHLTIRGIRDIFMRALPRLGVTNFPQSLRCLGIEGSMPPCLGLLHLAEVPLTCTVSFETEVTKRDIAGEGWNIVMRVLSKIWNPSIGTCSLFRFALSDEARFKFDFSEGRTVEVSLKIPQYYHLVFLVRFLHGLKRGEHFRRLISSSTWLELDVERFVDQRDQVDLLNTTIRALLHDDCKSLTSLHIVHYRIFGEEGEHITRLFQGGTSSSGGPEKTVDMSTDFLPALKHLRLDDLLFDDFAFVVDVNSFLKYRAQSQSPVDIIERVYRGTPEPLELPLGIISRTLRDGPGIAPLQRPSWQNPVSLARK